MKIFSCHMPHAQKFGDREREAFLVFKKGSNG